MTRIPSHSLSDAPLASRALLEELIQFSPTGRLLNMHAQMAHAPAVLEAYVGLRKSTASLGTLDQPVRTALMLAAATADGSEYALAVISMLALRAGWGPDQVRALRSGAPAGEPAVDALVAVVREAAADHGRVSDATWSRAAASGWTDAQLAEAFAYLGLTVFTSYFLNYAATELDLPAGA
ncbi:MAG TPA: carboxymuconolactone decarboxylase family protein [Streptosporangiaceae bacterium]